MNAWDKHYSVCLCMVCRIISPSGEWHTLGYLNICLGWDSSRPQTCVWIERFTFSWFLAEHDLPWVIYRKQNRDSICNFKELERATHLTVIHVLIQNNGIAVYHIKNCSSIYLTHPSKMTTNWYISSYTYTIPSYLLIYMSDLPIFDVRLPTYPS